jgi:hypothetical protein
MSEEEALKRKITQRWNVIAGIDRSPFPSGPKSAAFAQLEYIMQEAGLLARPRPRRARIENLEAAISAKAV